MSACRGHLLKAHGTDLIQLFQDRSEVREATYQLSGYHFHYRTKHGFLTTYEVTWASYFSISGTLFVSPPVLATDNGLTSTISVLHYLLTRAAQEEEPVTPCWRVPQCLGIPGCANPFRVSGQSLTQPRESHPTGLRVYHGRGIHDLLAR